MLYSKTENSGCHICANAVHSEVPGNMSCKFKGTVPEDFCCKKFKYDIFKKKVKPHKKLNLNKFTEKDFSI